MEHYFQILISIFRALNNPLNPANTIRRALQQQQQQQQPLNNADLESITDNITEFNNQLYQWRNRIEINPDAQVRVIRDTIDETRSMVSVLE